MDDKGRHTFVCGHPIAHSRSPLIHNYWLSRYAIPGTYRTIDIEPTKFTQFMSDLPVSDFVGGNVTIPHKEAAYALAARSDDMCHLIGAANTLWIKDNLLHATNTDAQGFTANLDQQAPGWDKATSALILGAGGASRAVIFALQSRGFSSIMVANRTLQKAVELTHRFGPRVTAHTLDAVVELSRDVGLIINTTPLGMSQTPSFSIDFSNAKSGTLVTDIVYVPLRTPMLASAAQAGLRCVDGLGMLLHQAAPGFHKWFGIYPEVTPELRNAIVEDLVKFQ